MTPKTTKSSDNPANRAQIERSQITVFRNKTVPQGSARVRSCLPFLWPLFISLAAVYEFFPQPTFAGFRKLAASD
jgi:hypothetical protein